MRNMTIAVMVLVVTVVNGQTPSWVSRYDGPGHGNDSGLAIVLYQGTPYVTGFQTELNGSKAFVTIRYDPETGNRTKWPAYQSSPGLTAKAATLAASSVGNIYVVGQAFNSDYEDEFTVVKYDPVLEYRQWVYTEAREEGAAANAVATRDDTAYAVGYYYRDEDDASFRVVKLRPDGNRIWQRDWDHPLGNDDFCVDEARTVAVDVWGNVCAAGYGEESLYGSSDFATVKWSPTGGFLWAHTYNGPGNGDDEAMAVDPAGNIYVTGTSVGTGTSYDYATVKYGPDGTQLWVARYSGPDAGFDEARAIAVDDSGNVYVTGTSDGGSTALDFLTVKYAADGSQRWVRRYNGLLNGDDEAFALALDTANRWLYVAGYRTTSSFNADYFVIKYSVAGESLAAWAYDGETTTDVALGIATDRNGNVYATGSSYSSSTGYDIVTVKWHQAFDLDVGVSRLLSPPQFVDIGDTVQPSAVITNQSTLPTGEFMVKFTIGSFYADSTVLEMEPAQAETTLSFQPWVALQPGTHIVKCTVALKDSNLSNNILTSLVTVAPAGWFEKEPMPATPSGKAVKDGGWLSFDPGSNLIYGAKGNKSADFYRYHINGDSWHELTVIPPGTEAKLPYKGCVGAADGAGHVYMTKGNNTLGFWKYYADGDSWEQIADVPLGNSNKKVKGGTDMVYVVKNETNRA